MWMRIPLRPSYVFPDEAALNPTTCADSLHPLIHVGLCDLVTSILFFFSKSSLLHVHIHIYKPPHSYTVSPNPSVQSNFVLITLTGTANELGLTQEESMLGKEPLADDSSSTARGQ